MHCQMRGFTLIELLVTMAIAIILATMAVPSYETMIENSQLTARRDALANALRYARSTALNQNITAEVCPIGTAGSTTCGTDWTVGWMVVLFNPLATAPTLSQAIQVPTTSLAKVYSETDAVVTTAPTSLNFNSLGLTNAATSALFVICDSRGKQYGYTVGVQSTGFIAVGNAANVDVLTGGAISTGGSVCP